MASRKHCTTDRTSILQRILCRHLDHIRDRTHSLSLSTTESSQDDITNPNLQDFEVSPDQTPPDESPSTGAIRKEIATGLNDMVGTLTFNRGGNVVSLRHGTNMELTLR